ncbi:hypothetical protein [Telmatospirillum siberiense]|uniref:hypothetical protein n=1 Tax=Telmatospirillum siberiense TaxID=382514 RepID=UPI001F5318A3|nr:hypothetical protein [Telmatospirillum siberiense]
MKFLPDEGQGDSEISAIGRRDSVNDEDKSADKPTISARLFGRRRNNGVICYDGHLVSSSRIVNQPFIVDLLIVFIFDVKFR